MTYVETDCTFTHRGRAFEAGGAVVTTEYAIGYVQMADSSRDVGITNWHGELIGHGHITSAWRTSHSFISTHQYQIEATIDDVTYTGRSAGNGMIWKGKRKARQ